MRQLQNRALTANLVAIGGLSLTVSARLPMLNKDDLIRIGALVAKLGLDYIRWTQLVPMILMWALMFIMLAGLGVVGVYEAIKANPETADAVFERVEPTLDRLLSLAPEPDAATANDSSEASDSGITVTEDDIVPWILRGWGILAFVGILLSGLRTWMWGAPTPWPLRRKLGIAGVASIVMGPTVLGVMTLIDPTQTQTVHVVVYGLFVPLVLFILSAWALGVGHIVNRVKQFIDTLVSKHTSTSAIWTQDGS